MQGLVRSIGVSNFSVKKLEIIMSYADIPPAVCQVCAYVRVQGWPWPEMADMHTISCLAVLQLTSQWHMQAIMQSRACLHGSVCYDCQLLSVSVIQYES